jgi:hypothetical protein
VSHVLNEGSLELPYRQAPNNPQECPSTSVVQPLPRSSSAEGLALGAADQQEEIVLQIYRRQIIWVQLEKVTEGLRFWASLIRRCCVQVCVDLREPPALHAQSLGVPDKRSSACCNLTKGNHACVTIAWATI